MEINRLIPNFIRSRLIEAIVKIFSSYRRNKSKSIPYYELEKKHIENLKILVDRNELLSLLPQNAIVAEIGVDQGSFSESIIKLSQPQKLHLIDGWGDVRYHDGLALLVEKKFEKEINQDKVKIHKGYSTKVLNEFPDNYFDWIYIDTDHSYKTTIEELMISKNKVKECGFICGHDFVTGNWNGGVRYGVIEAVHEFCLKENWEMIYLTNETHRHLSFAIRKIK